MSADKQMFLHRLHHRHSLLAVVIAAGLMFLPRVAASSESALQGSAVSTSSVDPVIELQAAMADELREKLMELNVVLDSEPGAIGRYSARGDLHMFLGMYAEAVSDYQQMVRLDPDQEASHWRLGIALFFSQQPEQAAAQFDKYHSFDNVDRENGIWRYLSHCQAYGTEKARAELLRYEKDDRPPFPEVYRLFDGSLTAAQVLSTIPEQLPEPDRQSRLFYSDLYIGMLEVVQENPTAAQAALRRAVENEWPKSAGYGPRYMWHVARLQYCELQKASKNKRGTEIP